MGGRYDFKSSGAAISGALSDFMVQQKMEARQRMLDDLNSKNINSQMADRVANRAIEDRRTNLDEQKTNAGIAAQEAATANVGLTANRANAELLPKGTPMTPEVESLLGPLAPALTEHQGGAMDPSQGEGPTDTKVFSGTTKQDQFDENAALKERLAQLAATAKAEHDKVTNDLAEQRISHAQAVLLMQQQNADVLNKLREVQMLGAQTKQDTAAKADADKAASIKNSRAGVRGIAQEIMDASNLGDVVGPVNGRTHSVMPASVDLDSKIQRLMNMLAMEGRGQLKGQGAISDFETKMLMRASTALNQRTDTDHFKQELRRIIAASGGDSPQDSLAGYDANGDPVGSGAPTGKPTARDLINRYSQVPVPGR